MNRSPARIYMNRSSGCRIFVAYQITYSTLGSGASIAGFGFRVQGFGLRVQGFGCGVSGFGFRASGFGFQGFGFRASGSCFMVVCFVLRASSFISGVSSIQGHLAHKNSPPHRTLQ